MSESALTVEVSDRSGWAGIDIDHWSRIGEETLRHEGVELGSLDLLFVTAEEMADLNRQFMGHHGPTDVLSFPLDLPPSWPGPSTDGISSDDGTDSALPAQVDKMVPVHLGDVVVCPEVAQTQAQNHCGHFESELTLLVVHGILHILGHDHGEEDERTVMVAHEMAHLARYGLDHPEPVGS